MQKIIEVADGVPRHPDYRFAHPLNFTLYRGTATALCGPNGGGKSLLVDMLTGKHPLCRGSVKRFCRNGDAFPIVRHITFRNVYGSVEPAYYQQRWNNGDEMCFPTVRELLQRKTAGNVEREDEQRSALLEQTGVSAYLDKSVNLLSSGELRRFQLVRVLLDRPDVLIIDNPYIGLDAAARQMLTDLLAEISKSVTLLFAVSRSADIPPFVKLVVHVEGREVRPALSRDDYLATYTENNFDVSAVPHEHAALPDFREASARETSLLESNEIVAFRNLNIRYGTRQLFRDFSWRVKRGEHWALTGSNGSGKTTLLSLICADNPWAYACDISLFGHRRGTGESIWDIKRHIGYVSPEMFGTYRQDITLREVVAGGLYDIIGRYRKLKPEDIAVCDRWLRLFGIGRLAESRYMAVSDGEQRLALLVRAFVKSPDLLVLDEPFHGLDDGNRKRAMRVIADYLSDSSKTLIMVSHYKNELPDCINRRLCLDALPETVRQDAADSNK